MSDVPNNENFSLIDVYNSVHSHASGVSSNLSSCFSYSVLAYFDPTYNTTSYAPDNSMKRFRNYRPVTATAPIFTSITFPNGITSYMQPVETNCSDGGSPITERGIWYNTTGPTPTGTKVLLSSTTGSITTNISGMSPGTSYYFTAYATNAIGTTYYSFASSMATMPYEYIFAGTGGYFNIPSRLIKLTVECVGSGGAGGAATGSNSVAGGGAGGSYARYDNLSVAPGQQYGFYSDTGGVGNIGNANGNGADSYFSGPNGECRATGGAAGLTATGTYSTGGVASTSTSVGTTIYKGGNGGSGYMTSSGGGGGAAGSTGAGNNGSNATPGAAKSNYGGAGGAGVSVVNTYNNGGSYGGGGSGGKSPLAGTDTKGGNGGSGMVRLTFP